MIFAAIIGQDAQADAWVLHQLRTTDPSLTKASQNVRLQRARGQRALPLLPACDGLSVWSNPDETGFRGTFLTDWLDSFPERDAAEGVMTAPRLLFGGQRLQTIAVDLPRNRD